MLSRVSSRNMFAAPAFVVYFLKYFHKKISSNSDARHFFVNRQHDNRRSNLKMNFNTQTSQSFRPETGSYRHFPSAAQANWPASRRVSRKGGPFRHGPDSIQRNVPAGEDVGGGHPVRRKRAWPLRRTVKPRKADRKTT